LLQDFTHTNASPQLVPTSTSHFQDPFKFAHMQRTGTLVFQRATKFSVPVKPAFSACLSLRASSTIAIINKIYPASTSLAPLTRFALPFSIARSSRFVASTLSKQSNFSQIRKMSSEGEITHPTIKGTFFHPPKHHYPAIFFQDSPPPCEKTSPLLNVLAVHYSKYLLCSVASFYTRFKGQWLCQHFQ